MINGKIARRATPSSTEQTEFLDAAEINREMLSIAESQNAIPRRSNNAGGKLDRSKLTMVNADDMKDLENLEHHVLSVIGYEPRKIRKIADTLNAVQDSGNYIYPTGKGLLDFTILVSQTGWLPAHAKAQIQLLTSTTKFHGLFNPAESQ